MPDLIVHSVNATYDKIACEESIAQELYDYFSFKVPDADIMRRMHVRLRKWDGYRRLFTKVGHRLYSGLRPRLEKFAADRGYTVEVESEWIDSEFSRHEALEFIKTLHLPFTPKDYQIDAFVKAVRKNRQLILSPTASGKSLIIYLIVKYFKVRTLIIVPTVNLVNQMAGHFKEYGGDENGVHLIYSGEEKQSPRLITISTWQSIYQLPKEYFNDSYEMIIVDECHHAQADSIKHLMESATEVNRRFGFTGTLNETEVHRLILEGLFGEVTQVTTTAELIERGDVADLRIKALILKYSDPDRKAARGLEYPEELSFIVTHESRKEFINNLVQSLDGNKIVLFRLVEKHGKVLYQDLKRRLNTPVYYISGATPGDEREMIRKILSQETQATLVGSYGCVSTGFDAPSLKHVIFASPYKSKIKVLQSIGRGLRSFKDAICTVYDIADDLTFKKKMNMTLKHFIERVRIYNEERFKYKIYKIQLK